MDGGWETQVRGHTPCGATLSQFLSIRRGGPALPAWAAGPPSRSGTAVQVPSAGRGGSSRCRRGWRGCLTLSAVGARAKFRGAVDGGQESALGLPQEPGPLPASALWFTPSCLGVQGPQPCGRRHRGDRLSPSCPGLCDERAGHVEEVGCCSQPA